MRPTFGTPAREGVEDTVKMTSAIRLLLLFVFAVFIPTTTYSQNSSAENSGRSTQKRTQRAALQGRVLDPDNRGVSNARVTLFSGLSSVAEHTTDLDGRYQFDGLHDGNYRVIANLTGFSDGSVEVDLHAGDVRTLDLRLKVSAVEEQVVVSASLSGALSTQIGSSTTVVGRQEIQDQDAESIYESIRQVPGVEVSQTGRRGGATSLFIRGGNSNYNLILVDGIQLNQFGGDFDFASIGTDGVQRIEVSRGPESALFGANAVAGVVNVVSETGDGPPHFSILAEGGSLHTRRFAGGGGGLYKGFSWAFNLSRLDTDGAVPNDYYRNQSSYVSLGYSRSPKRQFIFHFFGNSNSAGAPGPYGSNPDDLFKVLDPTSRDKQNLFAYQASYSEQLTSRLKQVFTVSVAPDRSYFISPFGDSFGKNLRVVANTHGEFTVSKKDVFLYGFEYNRERIQNTFIADGNNDPFLLPRASYGYFVENRWNPTRRWFLTTGLRVDNIRTGALPPDEFGSRPLIPENSVAKVNPRIATSYTLRDASSSEKAGTTRIHGSFGTGIRAPNGFELAFTDNPALKPEKSISFDAGVEQRFLADRAIFDVTYFYNRYKDQIVVLGSLQNLSTFSSANLANARADGLETSLRFRPLRSVEVSATYTWLNSKILAVDGTSLVPSPFQVGQSLLRRPRSSASYNITWRHHNLMLNTNAFIRGATLDVEPNDGTFACQLKPQCFFRNPGYVLANAGFAYQLPHDFEIHGKLNNFANQKYEDAFGFPSLRLNFLTGIRFQFPGR